MMEDGLEIDALEVFTQRRLQECGDTIASPFIAYARTVGGDHVCMGAFGSIALLREFAGAMTPKTLEVIAATGESSQAIFDAIVGGGLH